LILLKLLCLPLFTTSIWDCIFCLHALESICAKIMPPRSLHQPKPKIRNDGEAYLHQVTTKSLFHLNQSYLCHEIDHCRYALIIMLKDGKKETLTHGKSKKKLPELLGGKGSRESKRARKSEPLTPTTVSSLLTSTPTSNLSSTLSQSITSNEMFCSTVQTLQLDNLSTAPTFEVKMSAKTKKPAYSVNFKSKKKSLESSRRKGSRESK
jgi:hypothetical protein